jgi:hypothetical protein
MKRLSMFGALFAALLAGVSIVGGTTITAAYAGGTIDHSVTSYARTSPSSATDSLQLTVSADPGRQASLAANYVAIVADVINQATGQPVAKPYALRADVRDASGVPDPTIFHMAYPYGDDPSAQPGRYTGVVIVPRGGTWKIVVNVFDRIAAETEQIPPSLATGEVTVEVDAGELLGTGIRAAQSATKADPWEVLVRLLHVFVGLVWFSLAGFLSLVGWRDRFALTGALGGLVERNERRLSSALLWATGAMWISGILNLRFATAFAPPLSIDQAERLFFAPYARPYIYMLYAKIAVYALLSVLVIPILRRARNMVELGGDDTVVGRPRGVGLTAALVAGGAVILVCVTLLTYLHVVSERAPIQR